MLVIHERVIDKNIFYILNIPSDRNHLAVMELEPMGPTEQQKNRV